MMGGPERQTSIYLRGVSGVRPKVPADATHLEERARKAMSRSAWAYVAAGAGTSQTIRNNREGFAPWRIVPRMLRDVSKRDPSIELFGRRLPSPIMLSPVGVLELAHDDADLAVARAARSEGVPMIFSNQASTPMERVAEELGDTPRWFQLYWSTSNELVESFVARAERCGCEAIVITLDTTILSWRSRDLDVAFLPFLRGMGIAQYTSDPVFQRMVAERPPEQPAERPRPNLRTLKTLIDLTRAYPERFPTALRSGRARAAVQHFTQIFSNPSLAWEDLSHLRERTRLPILLKGILHPDDASKAIDIGMDGVIVSNHGGRQLDGAMGAIEALPDVVAAVDGRVPVIFDSGVRGGADIFKALALGATAVGIGRPYVYGLAIAGEDGVREVIQNLAADFHLTMGLAGRTSIADITTDALVRAG
jgi:lactate 2-monooxygenase